MSSVLSFSSATILTMFSGNLQASFSMPWWGWILVFIVIVLIVLFLMQSSDKKDASFESEAESISMDDGLLSVDRLDYLSEEVESPRKIVTAAPSQTPAVLTADDLTIIEGIGPKINDFLMRSGITTFRQLADMDMEALDKMLADANFGIANPETWAEQAILADKGEWEALKTLQDTLVSGRRKN